MRNKLTVVVPTYKRHHLLEQVLPHLLSLDTRILVIDSSETPHAPSSSNPRIDYVHCPDLGVLQKIRKHVVERVHTPYMLMNADDIFPSRQAITECVDFLENNPDYSSAQGVILYHENGRVYPHEPDSPLYQADADSAGARLLQHFTNYHPMFYSVQRADCWKVTLDRIPAELVNYNFSELYMVMMMLAHGKAAKFPSFFHVTNLVPSLNVTCLRLRGKSKDMIFNGRYFPELEAIKKTVSRYLYEREALPERCARRFIEGALALLFVRALRRKTFYWIGDRPPKTLGDRIRKEWTSFLRKTILREKKALDTAQKKACEKSELERILEQSGVAGRNDFNAIMKILHPAGM
ncbi:MAG: TIGR00180 family glycosyltransferase [Pseudodesulfovibrio sp.]|uniref:Glycosyltransferase 2-like domain-containing protein n=1 Tax=Pseudodesulfovibrio aespoeensis (strain ATCC 700646 / DSM 10631 / Aspo-2) TaxID=643562 RepID=E6VSC1_PSEA9|nr:MULTISPECIES: TIGR00180 family glycosyltransferase [Pseudodesulfovibrio]MBU4516443.1 TIGR00180 family glycosyltransferase [Pseudomonadota bacterium]ADU64264.1 hypothetical protein Daes_3276 [Pseudodesulfovibrio aespoeensis Aspo-2]MBU4523090.1 TIGR00180 family glycosyltransferase [Pseudomonadota bacterium]MBU4558056.1 TIGR00180 family glycosyltransferase [Pseudomonadota bacterium]MBV1766149.1 TIGR00180 family glycosyltransferase [Pseudodesulfovibrio sp.]